LSQRNVLKPEAANEARREIARNAPPQQRFSQKNETITKNNEAKIKIPDGQMKFAKVRSCFLQGLRNDSWRQTCRCEVSRTPDGRA